MFLLGIYNNGKRVFGSFFFVVHNLGNFVKISVSPSQILKLNGYREFGSPWRLYPRASLVAQRLKHLPAVWETWVRSLG